FCLPSAYEGFGVPYLEALACGLPVVATPNLGAREVLQDGALGVLARPDRLGAELVALLQDPARREQLAAEGRGVAVDRYAWPVVIAQYEQLYESLLAENEVVPV